MLPIKPRKRSANFGLFCEACRKSAIGSVGTLEEQAAAAAAPRRGKKAAAETKDETPAVEEAPAAEEAAPTEENKTEE